jgi:hypothetical protein
MKLFEFALIYRPKLTKEQKDNGENPKAELVQDVKRILALDEKSALMQAARAIPKEYETKLDLVEIALRPF